MGLAGVWLAVSLYLAAGWVRAIGGALPPGYLWWAIGGMALLPGFLMSAMFFSNLLHRHPPGHPHTDEPVTVILCVRNEETNIPLAIRALRRQKYAGHIHILAVDNGSTDGTRRAILAQQAACGPGCSVEYVACPTPGKANALNAGLARVRTPHFLTVDADTWLEENAVQRIMDHIVARNSACVAGNLFAANGRGRLWARMQNYDYLLSIAAEKRFQGSFSADAMYSPEPRYRVDTSSVQVKLLLSGSLRISPVFSLSFRLSERYRTYGRPFRTDARLDFGTSLPSWNCNVRVNVLHCESLSWLSYAEGGYRADRLSVWFRAGAFMVDNWDDRIYAYERDAPGNFNSPAYYGRGYWLALTSSVRLSRSVRLYFRGLFQDYPWLRPGEPVRKPPKVEMKLQLSLDLDFIRGKKRHS